LVADVVGEAGDFAAPGRQPGWMDEIIFRHEGSVTEEAERR
jgi:hypothetical protein